jgi:hypothetical protein
MIKPRIYAVIYTAKISQYNHHNIKKEFISKSLALSRKLIELI